MEEPVEYMYPPAANAVADPATISTRTAWLSRLQAHGLTLRGHRLIKASTAEAGITPCIEGPTWAR